MGAKLLCAFLFEGFCAYLGHNTQTAREKIMPILFLVIFLPILEIIGFIVIGGQIGVGLSLLWVMADVFVGSLVHNGRENAA